MADNKKEMEREELHRAIWAIADELRGAVDGWDFKNYVLGTMFYRYVSENLCSYINTGEIEAGNADFDYAAMPDEEAEEARDGLVEEKGFSFPSGHSLAVTLMVGTLIVILSQRIKDPVWRKVVQIVLGFYLVSVLLSRVYLGVHYPSDVLASFCVGLGVLFIEFPFYDKLRFQWRFKGKQK